MLIVTADLMTHVPLIDEQHTELFNRINAVSTIGSLEMARHETEATLDFLGEYIIKHFSDEEELMQQSGYTKYDWHHEMHRWYIAEFRKLREEFMLRGVSVEFTQLLEKSIINWIVHHIGTVDVSLGQFINDSKRPRRH